MSKVRERAVFGAQEVLLQTGMEEVEVVMTRTCHGPVAAVEVAAGTDQQEHPVVVQEVETQQVAMLPVEALLVLQN